RSGGDPSAARAPSVEAASAESPAAIPLRLTLGYAFALIAAASFGIGGVIAKAAFDALAPSVLSEFRVFFAFLVFLLVFGITRPRELRIERRDIPLFAVFGIVGLAGVSLVYY